MPVETPKEDSLFRLSVNGGRYLAKTPTRGYKKGYTNFNTHITVEYPNWAVEYQNRESINNLFPRQISLQELLTGITGLS